MNTVIFKHLGFVGVVLLLAGCPQFPVTPNLAPPPASVVLEDSSGQKHVLIGQPTGNLALFKWNNNSQPWQKSLDIPNSSGVDGTVVDEIYLDSINKPQSIFFYDVFDKVLREIETVTMLEAKRQKFPNNYSIISADEFVVYSGSQVDLYTLSTGIVSNSHMLPALAEVNAALSLNIDTAQFQMLCTPEGSRRWDYKAHFCIVAQEIGYPNAPSSWPTTLSNYYEIIITVNSPNNYSYKILFQWVLDPHAGNIVTLEERNHLVLSEEIKRNPDYSSVVQINPTVQRADTFTIDNQGNLHLFYVLKGDSNIYYEYYTQNNPTTPLYTQVLP